MQRGKSGKVSQKSEKASVVVDVVVVVRASFGGMLYRRLWSLKENIFCKNLRTILVFFPGMSAMYEPGTFQLRASLPPKIPQKKEPKILLAVRQGTAVASRKRFFCGKKTYDFYLPRLTFVEGGGGGVGGQVVDKGLIEEHPNQQRGNFFTRLC